MGESENHYMKWEYRKNSMRIPSSETRVRHGVIPASYLLLIKKNHVLLLRRFQTGFEDGKYSLVAGHVEEGETFTTCMIREAKEEIGITVKPKDLFVAHVMHRNAGKNNERMDVFFVTTEWTGKIMNKEPHKCDDLSWYDLEKLPENTISYIEHAIRQIVQEECYSEWGWK